MTTTPTTPNWKDALEGQVPEALSREIDLFEAQMGLRKAGKIDEKLFAESRLRRGVYGQRYDNGQRHDGVDTVKLDFPCGDLKARLQNPVTEREALDYLERIATALSAVHRQGILHRELKPPHIMLREDGQIVLIDFGISRSMDQGARSTAVPSVASVPPPGHERTSAAITPSGSGSPPTEAHSMWYSRVEGPDRRSDPRSSTSTSSGSTAATSPRASPPASSAGTTRASTRSS